MKTHNFGFFLSICPEQEHLIITSFLIEELKLERLGDFGLKLQVSELVQVDRTFVDVEEEHQ